jgi:hypothetical protein
MKLKVIVLKWLVFVNVSAEDTNIKIRDKHKEADPGNHAF